MRRFRYKSEPAFGAEIDELSHGSRDFELNLYGMYTLFYGAPIDPADLRTSSLQHVPYALTREELHILKEARISIPWN